MEWYNFSFSYRCVEKQLPKEHEEKFVIAIEIN